MPLSKRNREPMPAGSKSFPFREPKDGTRWKALLDAMGYDPRVTPRKRAEVLLQGVAVALPEAVQAEAVRFGLDPAVPYVADLLHSKACWELELTARALEEYIEARATKDQGAPPNDSFLELIAFAVVRFEERKAREEGRTLKLVDVAQKLCIHPDALRRAYNAGMGHFFALLGNAAGPTLAQAKAWVLISEGVEAHWPAIASRMNPRN